MKYNYSPTRNTIIQVAEKAGVESVRYLILREEKIANPHNIWINNNRFFGVTMITPPKEINNISIVRNPYARLVSGYIDKFLTGNYNHLPFCQNVKKHYNNRDDNLRVSFQELVNYIINQPKNELDVHFKPQYLQHKLSNNSIILKLENINEINNHLTNLGFSNRLDNYRDKHLYRGKKVDIKNAHTLLYKDFDIAENRENRENLYPKGCGGLGYQGAEVPTVENFYTKDLKDKVYNYYKEDFLEFKYSY
jgi:hypothetical protein